MPINKIIKYIFLAMAVFFQLYLAYASTLYFNWKSTSFFLVVSVAVVCIFAILYFVCIASEREDKR